MPRPREGVERPPIRAARIVAAGLALLAVGCAETSGLRSVWPDRPSLLGLRDRHAEPEPDPAGDYYTRYMQAVRERAHAPVRRPTDVAAGPTREDARPGPPGPDDPIVDREAEAAPGARTPSDRPDASTDPTRGAGVRVTLGTPEPLPVPSRRADAVLASTSPPPAPDVDNASPRHPTAPGRARLAPRSTAPVGSAPAPGPVGARPSAPDPSQEARAVVARSEARLRSLVTYQVKMNRVERVDGRLQPEEEVILSVHRQPREVRLEWAAGPSQGREVIYSTRVDARSLFVHMPKGAIPLPTMKMAIDSPMVTRSSRHSIAEAGFETIIHSLRQSLDQDEAAGAANGRIVYRGVEKPPGLDRPGHVFTRRTPGGESWTVFLDAQTLLPSMVVAKDASGQLDEKYVYHEVSENPPDLAAADAFDPDRRWGAPKGLLSRFARGGDAPDRPGTGQAAVR